MAASPSATTHDVYVGNLPIYFNESHIRDIFDVAGDISSVKIMPPKGNGKVAFVKFLKEADALCVAQYMSNHQLEDGRNLIVKFGPRPQKGSSPSKPLVNGKVDEPVIVDEKVVIYVSYVASPIEFYGQMYNKELATKLDALTKSMEALCPSQPKVVGQLSTDQIYGCKFSFDGMWYRCQIQKCLPKNEIDVRYIDYGNSEITNRFGLVTLPAEVLDLPPLCEFYQEEGLELIDKERTSELYIKGLGLFTTLISEQRIEIKIVKKDKNRTFVNIQKVLDGEILDIHEKMITTGSVKKMVVPDPILQTVKSPVTGKDKLRQPSKSPIKVPSSPSNQVNEVKPIMSVDAGVDERDVPLLSYKSILNEFAQKHGTPPPSYATVPVDGGKFFSTVTVNGVQYKAVNIYTKSKEAEQDAAQVALNALAGIALPIRHTTLPQAGEVTEDGFTEVYVSHVESPIHFWGQSYNAELEGKLFHLMLTMEDMCPTLPRLTEPPSNDIYACQFSQDGLWYRCQVEKTASNSEVNVRYIDYGNAETTSIENLVTLPADTASMAPLCSLYKIGGLDLINFDVTSEIFREGEHALHNAIGEQKILLQVIAKEDDVDIVNISRVLDGPLIDIETLLVVTGSVALEKNDSDAKPTAEQTTASILVACTDDQNWNPETTPLVNGVESPKAKEVSFDTPDKATEESWSEDVVDADIQSSLGVESVDFSEVKESMVYSVASAITTAEIQNNYMESHSNTISPMVANDNCVVAKETTYSPVDETRLKTSLNASIHTNTETVEVASKSTDMKGHLQDDDVEAAIQKVTCRDVGGYKKELDEVKAIIELPLRHSELFNDIGIKPPRGVLLSGPQGVGKTLVARAVANESQVFVKEIFGPEIVSSSVEEANKNLSRVFKQVVKNAPAILIIDQIDAIAPKAEVGKNKMVGKLLSLLSHLQPNVVVISTAVRSDDIDPVLRRAGLFIKEISMCEPDVPTRLEILHVLTAKLHLSQTVILENIAEETEGYIGSDLSELCTLAVMHRMQKRLASMQVRNRESLGNLNMLDFKHALEAMNASIQKRTVDIPSSTTRDDIFVMEDIKNELKALRNFTDSNDVKRTARGDVPSGLILRCPRGCGEQMLAAASTDSGESRSVNGPERCTVIDRRGMDITDSFSKAFSKAAECIKEDPDKSCRLKEEETGNYVQSSELIHEIEEAVEQLQESARREELVERELQNTTAELSSETYFKDITVISLDDDEVPFDHTSNAGSIKGDRDLENCTITLEDIVDDASMQVDASVAAPKRPSPGNQVTEEKGSYNTTRDETPDTSEIEALNESFESCDSNFDVSELIVEEKSDAGNISNDVLRDEPFFGDGDEVEGWNTALANKKPTIPSEVPTVNYDNGEDFF